MRAKVLEAIPAVSMKEDVAAVRLAQRLEGSPDRLIGAELLENKEVIGPFGPRS